MKASLIRWLGAITITAALSALGGCALTNPYIDFEKDYQRSGVSTAGIVVLPDAVKYAQETKSAYRAALGDRAEFRNVLGIGLIGLTTAAMAIGINGGSSTAILGLGAASAGGYAIATWLDSRPTERAYIAGYNAINCAMDAVEPFRIAKSDDKDWQQFETGLSAIDQNIQAVETKIGEIQGILSAHRFSAERVAAAQSDVTAATTVVANAVTVRRNGVSLRREMRLTGTRLVAAVDRITGEVDMAVLRSQPDLQALSSIISGLGAAYGQFTTVPESTKSAKDIGGEGDGAEQSALKSTGTPLPSLEEKRIALRTAVATLSTSSRQVGDFVNAVAADKPVAALRRCGVDIETIAGDISVEPSGPVEFKVGARSADGRVIIGGRAPYRASLVGSVTGLSVTQPELFGPAFLVQAADGLAKGEYSVLIADGAGHRKFVPVRVTEAVSGDGGSSGGGGEDPLARLDKTQVENLQKALCMEGQIDGRNGPKTRAAFKAYQQKEGAGKSDNERVQVLLALTPERVAERCEKNPSENDLLSFVRAISGGDIAFAVGKDPQRVDFQILKGDLAADGQSVIVTLKYLGGGPPEQEISLDAVKTAIRESAARDGESIGNQHLTLKDQNEIRKRLKKP